MSTHLLTSLDSIEEPRPIPSQSQPHQTIQALRKQVIDNALAQWEAANPPYYITAEQQQAIQQFWRQQQITTPDEQANWLQMHRLTSEQLHQLALQDFRLSQFKYAQWNNQIDAYFLQRQADLTQIVYSLIRVQGVELANDLYTRLQAGQSFAALAQQYSQGGEAKTGGRMGPVPLYRPHPVIRRILSNSNPGEVCTPQTIEGWSVLIRLEHYIPASLNEATRQQLLDELFNRWLQSQVLSSTGYRFM